MKCCTRGRDGRKRSKGKHRGKFNSVSVPISAIQVRSDHKLCAAKVEQFRMGVENGDVFPPIVLYPNYALKDGRNRLEAHELAGHTEIDCIIL